MLRCELLPQAGLFVTLAPCETGQPSSGAGVVHAAFLVLLATAARAGVVAADLGGGTLIRHDRSVVVMAVIAMGPMHMPVMIMIMTMAMIMIAVRSVHVRGIGLSLRSLLGIAHLGVLLLPALIARVL